MREYSDVEYVFAPHDNSLPAAVDYLREVWARRAFMVANARAAVLGGHSGTLLGGAWRVLDPLFQALIYWFLFTAIRGRSGSDYFLMVVSGVFLFTFTATILSEGGRAIQRSKGLVLNSSFPLATLPLAVIYKATINLVPTIGVYAIFHVAFGGKIGSGLFLLPMMFVLQVLISAGLALIFATLTVYIRDFSNLLTYIMRILMFMTPVIYPAEQLEVLPGIVHTLLHLNPIFTLFAGYQAVFAGDLPAPGYLAQTAVWAVVLPIMGFRLFVSRERGFALRL
jgi:teichoic acid transport system permease protein